MNVIVAPPGFQPRTTRNTRTKKAGSRISGISRLPCPVPGPPMPLPRNWNHIGVSFYKCAAPTVLPKLCAATLEREKAALQNAVTATDQQIDQLVYDLYGLTPEEIALVEGAHGGARHSARHSPRNWNATRCSSLNGSPKPWCRKWNVFSTPMYPPPSSNGSPPRLIIFIRATNIFTKA